MKYVEYDRDKKMSKKQFFELVGKHKDEIDALEIDAPYIWVISTWHKGITWEEQYAELKLIEERVYKKYDNEIKELKRKLSDESTED